MRTIDLSKIQAEIGAWSKYNFPTSPPINPAEGVVEEVGEIAHSRIKGRQGIRGTPEEHAEAERDGIADAGIFLLNLSAMLGLNMGEIAVDLRKPLYTATEEFADLACEAAELLSVVIGQGVLVAVERQARMVAASLCSYAHSRGWDFLELLEATWSEVRQRDWILYPKSGLPPVEAA